MTAEPVGRAPLAVVEAEDENPLRCYTAEQVADLLGMSPRFVRDEVQRGRLKGMLLGSGPNAKIRVTHHRLAEYLADREV